MFVKEPVKNWVLKHCPLFPTKRHWLIVVPVIYKWLKIKVRLIICSFVHLFTLTRYHTQVWYIKRQKPKLIDTTILRVASYRSGFSTCYLDQSSQYKLCTGCRKIALAGSSISVPYVFQIGSVFNSSFLKKVWNILFLFIEIRIFFSAFVFKRVFLITAVFFSLSDSLVVLLLFISKIA